MKSEHLHKNLYNIHCCLLAKRAFFRKLMSKFAKKTQEIYLLLDQVMLIGRREQINSFPDMTQGT